MQLRNLALTVLVAGANAQIPPEDVPIILSALPTSALAYISASGPAAFSHHIYSVFAAGSTPGWYENLPTSVQTDLVPTAGTNSTLPSGTGVIVNSNSSSLVVTKSSTTITKPVTPKAPTTTGGGGGGGGGGSGGGSGSESGSGSSSSSSDLAMPTAVVGVGLAGVVGLAGLFAL